MRLKDGLRAGKRMVCLALTTALIGSCFSWSGAALALDAPTGREQQEQTYGSQDATPEHAGKGETTQAEGAATQEEQAAVTPQAKSSGSTIVLTLGSKKATMTKDGKTTDMEMEALPFLSNDVTMVPLRFICENVLDSKVVYDGSAKTIAMTREDIQAKVDLKTNKVLMTTAAGTKDVAMATPPVVKNGVTYMPLRFFAELYQCTVDYAAAAKTITIKAPAAAGTPGDQPAGEEPGTGDDTPPSATGVSTIVLTLGSKKVTLKVDGKESTKEMEALPFEKNGNTMVPLRFICENVLNSSVVYDGAAKTIQLSREDIKAKVDLNTNKVYVTGDDGSTKTVAIPEPPVVKDDVTYMPLRFFAELYLCTVDYNSQTKAVTIKAPPADLGADPNKPFTPAPDAPVAQVGFSAITAGQAPVYHDTSYDPNNRTIVERQWMVEDANTGKTYKGSTLEPLVKNLGAGNHKVYLRVKNALGLWSAWFCGEMPILKNEAPIIKNLRVVAKDGGSAKTIKMGQAVDFEYTVENEDWEEITETHWTYSFNDGNTVRTKAGKPSAFFSQDTYDVTLKVKDAYGNWSDAVTCKVTPGSESVLSEAEFKFQNLQVGEIYLNHKNLNFNDIAVQAPAQNIVKDDIWLLASNNPESVDRFAILCQDKLQGDVRLRYHHANATSEPMRIAAIAHNEGDQPVTLTIGDNASAGPSTDAMQVGTTVMENFLTYHGGTKTKVLQPGEKYLINADTKVLQPGESLAGLIDVHAAGYVKFTIASLRETSSYQDYAQLPVCPKNSTHIRGTFPNATLHMSYELSGQRPEKIVLGREDAYDDYYIAGTDALTGEPVVNKGNRGVLQKLTIKADQKVALLFNPRGAIYKGVLLNIDGQIATLSTSGVMTGITESCTLGVIEAGQTVTLTYLPPSGSDTPVLIVAIPYSQLDEY